MAKVDSSPRQQHPGDSKMALTLLPVFVMSKHKEKTADLMQTDRYCWGWWRIHFQQHHSAFSALYPSYSVQIQWDQLYRDFTIWPLSSFPLRYQDLLHFYSSLLIATATLNTVQMCCKKSQMGSVVSSTIILLDVAVFNTQSWQVLSLFLWWLDCAMKTSSTAEVDSEVLVLLLALAQVSFTVLDESVRSTVLQSYW